MSERAIAAIANAESYVRDARYETCKRHEGAAVELLERALEALARARAEVAGLQPVPARLHQPAG